MNFNDLNNEEKQTLHNELTACATSIGGKNYFLQMIEDIKKEKPNILLNKSAAAHFTYGRISWTKSIYKDTLTLLYDAMKREEKTGDMLNGIEPKLYKNCMNMMKTLSSVNIIVKPKDDENGEGFELKMLDTTTPKKTKINLLFKIIFFYNIDFAKQVLSYKA